MNEAIALLIFGAMLIILLIMFSYAQVSLASLSAKLGKKIGMERERVKENLKAAWAGSYHIILVNDGSRDAIPSYIYAYINGSRVPIYRKDLDNNVLKAGLPEIVSLQWFGAKPDLDKGYARLFSTDPSIYFIDRNFLSGDELDFGPNGYSLHRSSGAGDLATDIRFAKSKKWSLCSWIKVERGADRSQILIEANATSRNNDIDLYFDAENSEIKARYGFTVLSSNGNSDPFSWNHYCVVITKDKMLLYINGVLESSANILFHSSFRVRSIALKDPSIGYWVDDLFIAPKALTDSQVRLLAAGSEPSIRKYVEFPFNNLTNEITRVDVITDLGIAHNFTRIVQSFPPPSMKGECKVVGTNPLSLDCGNVAPTSYIPLEIPGNYAGLYLLQYSRWIRYWNTTNYSTGVPLVYDSNRDVTVVNMSNGRGLQLISTLDLISNCKNVKAMLGSNITFKLINVEDGSNIQVKVRIETLSLTDLEKSDNEVRGRVIWANGDSYLPRGDWEYVNVIALETGDAATIEGDGSFRIDLTSSESEITLSVFFPEYELPIFQSYMVPFSGTYSVGGG